MRFILAVLAVCRLALAGGAGEGPVSGVRETVRQQLAQDNFRAALDAARAAVKQSPRSADAWSALAGALFRSGDFDGAEDAARKSLELRPADPDALVALARVLATQGEHAQARRELEAAIQADPVHPAALRLLAGCMDTNLERKKAADLARRFVELNPPGQELFVEHSRRFLRVLDTLRDVRLNEMPRWEDRAERIVLPLRVGADGLSLTLALAGQQRRFQLDTAEEGLTVSAETVRTLGLKSIGELPGVAATGLAPMGVVVVPDLEAAACRVRNVLAGVGASDLVGPGLFSGYRVKLDLAAGQLVLTRQPRDAAPHPKDIIAAPSGTTRFRFRALGKLIWTPVSFPRRPAAFKDRPAWGMLDTACEPPAALTPRCLEALRAGGTEGPQAIPLQSTLAGSAGQASTPQLLWVLPELSVTVLGAAVRADGALAGRTFGEISRVVEAEMDLIVGWPVLHRVCKSLEIDFEKCVLTVEHRRN
jgi:hypothetical protein